MALAIPSSTSIATRDVTLVVKLYAILFCLRIRREANQCDALVDLDHCRVQGRRAADVEIKDLGPRLVADQQEVFEPFRDKQCMFLSFTLEERVRCYRRREPDVVSTID
jgi:hypothetical protein